MLSVVPDMTPDAFFAEALPWAQKAHALCYVLVSVILAQWADETGYGGPDWSPNNNPGNVGSYDGKPVATFPTLQAGVDAYVQTMNLDYYTAVREATTADAQATALGESPWASGHYGKPPGSDLIAIIDNYDLTQYDGPPSGLVEGETMTSWQAGGQNHVCGVVGNKAYHWWQWITPDETKGQDFTWHPEALPTP